MNEFGKYRLFRKYFSEDGVNYTPSNEYKALLVENDSCQCGYREIEYRWDGEYKEEKYKKCEIWNEYSFCPTDSSYDELTGKVDYRNPIPNEGVMLATYRGSGTTSVKLCETSNFYKSIAINNVEKGSKYTGYTFNNYDINEVAFLDVKSIIDSAFYSSKNLTSVNIGIGITHIGDSAFQNCISLTSITIPSSVTTIGERVFEYCILLTYVTIGDGLTTIGERVFYNCEALISVTIGNSVTSIYPNAFYHCTSLSSVTIPESVTSIYNYAFNDCSSLTSVTIPDSVTYIGEYAFYETPFYNNLPNGDVYLGKCYYKYKGTMPSNTSITIKDGTKSICPYAFGYCSSLTSVTIPSSVERICRYSFIGCSGLTSITIPYSVTTIDSYTFKNCKSLKSITCYATTAPTLGSNSQGLIYVFDGLPTNGTLHVPQGSNYSTWLSKLPSGWTIEYI